MFLIFVLVLSHYGIFPKVIELQESHTRKEGGNSCTLLNLQTFIGHITKLEYSQIGNGMSDQ